MSDVKFLKQTQLPRWKYLLIAAQGGRSPFRDREEFERVLTNFQQTLRDLGIQANNFTTGQRIEVNEQNLDTVIDSAIGDIARAENRPTMLLVVIAERLQTPIYSRVKSACDIREGILNVCVIDNKFARANVQYFANVGLKVNLKLGGTNHALDPSKMGILREKKTMVVGIDVTHPSPGSSASAPSVAGIVASVDEWLAQWPADLRIQKGGQEMVAKLGDMFKSRLRLWQQRNRTLPENILIYRDGVSEGQYNLVLEEELPALRKACAEIYPATATKEGKPRITIIIVGKRHHTRFYPVKTENQDREGNPPNGTVVDRIVTEARNWDFFLQAHSALQGTARPAHYYIIYDQIFRQRPLQAPFASAADALEDLTHNMCYLFGRATKAISKCPPSYYADLLCDRARKYLSSLYEGGESDAASLVTTSAEGSAGEPDPDLITIHPNVRNSMFYM